MSKKTLFIVLALLACLYFASLGAGLALNDSGGSKDKNPSTVAKSWVGGLAQMLPFNAKRALAGPELCNGKPVTGAFEVTPNASTCQVHLKVPPKEDNAEFSVRLANTGRASAPIAVFVRSVFDQSEFPGIKDDPSCSPAATGVALVVQYKPDGASSSGHTCFLRKDADKPVDLAVTDSGGVLSLYCVKCKRLSVEGR